jgi:phenylpropionate dioxygenase-like ring-hydroxylating dioxygenase large terminal subunit
MIWATWDPDAPPFLDFLGDMKLYLDLLVDHHDGREGGTEVVGGVIKWRFPANWKFAAENFIGDGLHTISHRSVEIAGIGPGGQGQTRYGQVELPRNLCIGFPGGHGTAVGFLPHVQDYDPFPQFRTAVGPVDAPGFLQEYYRKIADERMKNLKGQMRPGLMTVAGIFPNVAFHSTFPRTLAVWHPSGPHMTEGWRWCFVEKDAPQEVKDVVRHHFMRYSGPGGMTEQDDMENWNYATEASRGIIARRYPYNYECGLGWEEPAGVLDAMICPSPTEANQRNYYRAYVDYMESNSWGEILERQHLRRSGNGR